MSRAVSREGFDERKNYLGVYMQQGRVVLDSDWNESQHIVGSLLRRLSREAVGDGSPNRGFLIDRIFPIPMDELAAQIEEGAAEVDPDDPGQGIDEAIQRILQDAVGNCAAFLFGIIGAYFFAPLLFFIQFPGELLDDGDSLDGWALDPPHGNLRLGRDVPFSGRGFLRVSGHPDTVRLVKQLPEGEVLDLSEYELMVFRFRMNRRVPGPIRFFMRDASGGETTWTFENPALAREQWMAGFAAPLDVRFRISTRSPLPTAYRKKPGGDSFRYLTPLGAVGGVPPITWDGSALPDWLELKAAGDGDVPDEALDQTRAAALGFENEPPATGTFTFPITITDAEGTEATKEFELTVEETSPSEFPHPPVPSPLDFLMQTAIYEIGEDGPVDTAQVVRYGFELYQDPGEPLAWDLDDLRLGSTELYEAMGANNFIIRGSELSQLQAQIALMGLIRRATEENPVEEVAGEEVDFEDMPDEVSDMALDLLEILNADYQIAQPGIDDAGKMYVNGYPCVLLHDTLYSMQADPTDPPIATPPPGSGTREDTVYLDVWEEPVTFVEDPDIREIALGGPDTSTRQRLRHCVRVVQGGPLPSGDGRGRGLLTTEGAYTGRDNRLFRVEIESAGDLGAATFRWSDENAAMIARVTRTIEKDGRVVLVENGMAFQAHDHVLIRSGLREERARIASVVDNVVTLVDPVADTYALADRPRIERWNAFGVAIPPDPADPLVSVSIPLIEGVRVRFGGRAMRRGDYWTFRTRYLARDQSAGVDPATRIEDLGFVRPHGIYHYYAPLARITRDENDGGRIHRVKDIRPRSGTAAVTDVGLPPLLGLTTVDAETAAIAHVGGTLLPPAGKESRFLVFLSGNLHVTGLFTSSDPMLTLLFAFYNGKRTDPEAEPDTGRIQDYERRLPLERVLDREVPIHITAVSSGTPFAFLPSEDFSPVSVEVFARIKGSGFTVELSNLRLTAVELKKTT
jgi:hypothetical protein